ncbi:MAG: hypothetical protein GON13_02630 [Nanoarchaeota archaeon]|nr:hypothetical protein [Nanoarchaeota archaeon]
MNKYIGIGVHVSNRYSPVKGFDFGEDLIRSLVASKLIKKHLDDDNHVVVFPLGTIGNAELNLVSYRIRDYMNDQGGLKNKGVDFVCGVGSADTVMSFVEFNALIELIENGETLLNYHPIDSLKNLRQRRGQVFDKTWDKKMRGYWSDSLKVIKELNKDKVSFDERFFVTSHYNAARCKIVNRGFGGLSEIVSAPDLFNSDKLFINEFAGSLKDIRVFGGEGMMNLCRKISSRFS